MRKRILISFFAAVMMHIIHGAFGEDVKHARDDSGVNCGLEKWKSYACDLETNRNFGCYRKNCWRSGVNANEPEKWCYTGKWCGDGKKDDNHTLCKDQVSSPCGEETSCGIKKWTVDKNYPCDSTTDRNYGCNKKHCWRSDNSNSCYTGASCWDGENDDNHTLCRNQTLSPCGEKHIREGVRCGELYSKNQASCNTSCGMKKWKVRGHPCNTESNRNYGCDKTQCWRSDADNHAKRCYTSKGCWDNKHNLCEDQILAPCVEKLKDVRPEGVKCGELNMKNPASCKTTCGVKTYTVDRSLPCDTTTNRNFGCEFYEHVGLCWRSDADVDEGWCYTGKYCQGDHLSCHGQTLLWTASCGSWPGRISFLEQ